MAIPVVSVAVTVITSGGRILSIWNPNWGAFSLPMTKPRVLVDPGAPGTPRVEAWEAAAARAAAEALRCTISAKALDGPIMPLTILEQSDRDGKVKEYRFQVFHLDIGDLPDLVGETPTEWLPPGEFDNYDRVPISRTARLLVGMLPDSIVS